MSFVVPKILNIEDTDERLWVCRPSHILAAQNKPADRNPGLSVSSRPLLLGTSQGYFVNILRVKRSGILSRHQHTGPVHAITLKGRWHYLEHDWWAEEGGYSFEPPGETHTLEVPEGCDEMATLFHVTGAYVYVEEGRKGRRCFQQDQDG